MGRALSTSIAKLWRASATALARVFATATAHAGAVKLLTDGQLDGVTAGGALVFSTADAQAAGLITMASTGANSVIGSNPGVEFGFGSESGIASGTAVSLASNGAAKGAPPATSGTNVTTGGAPEGNSTMVISANSTSSAPPYRSRRANSQFLHLISDGLSNKDIARRAPDEMIARNKS